MRTIFVYTAFYVSLRSIIQFVISFTGFYDGPIWTDLFTVRY